LISKLLNKEFNYFRHVLAELFLIFNQVLSVGRISFAIID